ncbi:MAG: hypothetical protein ACUZ8O_02840 [Candidatus Anammoxibacter sp.]
MDKKELQEKYIDGAFTAMCRAADKVAEESRRTNTPIPIWEDGKVVYKIPDKPAKGA